MVQRHYADPDAARIGLLLRWSICATVVGVSLLVFPCSGQSSPPNILLLVSDDQRLDTIHALGNEIIQTPNWDRLVAEGTTFTRAITAMPLCVASRAELLTGRDGLMNGKQDFGLTPKPDVPHLATTLQTHGYETCYVGKWHTVGRPSDSGYTQTIGLYAAGGGRFPLMSPVDWKGMPVTGYRGWIFQSDDGTLFPEKGVGLTPDISETFADAAIEFLQQKHERPFLLHVNFTAPHDPLFFPRGYEQVYTPDAMPLPANFAQEHPFDHGNARGRDELLFDFPRTPEQTRAALAVYYAVLSHLDEEVGRILDVLDEQLLSSQTIVIYTSDHGLAIGSHGLRGKQNMYEHTIGVPLIFRGPTIESGRTTTAQCYLRDLYATICDLVDIEIPATVHGRSLKPILRGETDQIHDAVFAHFLDRQRMIRTDEWKYISYPQVGRDQLFQLSGDPDELNDLADIPDHTEVKVELSCRLDRWRSDRNDPTFGK
ncbi:MAG: sulfatase-like hydrolase/transferase [Planctomycetaceae bacterium]|nr:sulfatase-like hydrolase/transferase [Planctomycetaceae bacterium]